MRFMPIRRPGHPGGSVIPAGIALVLMFVAGACGNDSKSEGGPGAEQSSTDAGESTPGNVDDGASTTTQGADPASKITISNVVAEQYSGVDFFKVVFDIENADSVEHEVGITWTISDASGNALGPPESSVVQSLKPGEKRRTDFATGVRFQPGDVSATIVIDYVENSPTSSG